MFNQVQQSPSAVPRFFRPAPFTAFLACNWGLCALTYLLEAGGYVSEQASSIGLSLATLGLIAVAFAVIAAVTREVQVRALWPAVYTAVALAFFARFQYFLFYPVGGWPGLWPSLPPAWERALTNSLIYAAEIILVVSFCRVLFTLRGTIARLREEQRLLREEQEAHRRAQEQSRRLEQQLLQAQKMESIGRLAGGVAHDLNNMLTPILAYAGMLESDFPAESPLRADLQEITAAAERASDLTRQLLAFARKQTLEIKPVSLNEIIANLDKLLRRLLQENISLRFRLKAAANIAADVGQIEQVLMNLVVNAQDAMPGGGVICIETEDVVIGEARAAEQEGIQPGPHVMLVVSDTGEGMDKQTCDMIFEPFFTTKRLGKGVGLGLSTTHGIVKQHRGSISVYSELGKGATFRVFLPATGLAAAAPSPPGNRPRPPHGPGTVLIAEDNAQVRSLAARVLRANGYSVLEASDGKSALEMASAWAGPLALLVTDVVMPDMNGKALHESLAAKRPGLRVLYMSGYSNNVIEHHGVLEPDIHFIQKPFSIESFLDKVGQALA